MQELRKRLERILSGKMKLQAVFACLILLLPGCFAEEEDEEIITFNGTNLNGNPVYEFKLETAYGDLWNLSEEEGKIVILAFIFTRCDNTCPVTSENLKVVKERLTESELEEITFVSVTVDKKHDSPERLREWSEDRGYDWPHLTGSSSALDMVYETYGVYPVEQEDNSSEGYTVAHPSPTYIIDSDTLARVVWSDYDFPTDLFLDDVRTVLENY